MVNAESNTALYDDLDTLLSLLENSKSPGQQPDVRAVYYGSNGGATRKLICQLKQAGEIGNCAAHLFRAQKASSRAKRYRGGIRSGSGEYQSYRDLAYTRKEDALSELCCVLISSKCELRWGWRIDPKQPHAKWVLYVELPNGQCSFHSPSRFDGPDYEQDWDGSHESENRIIDFCERVIATMADFGRCFPQ